ncbi:DUF1538 domain-containing protein [Natronogracilivirga saccharolytica]|uniref:DUF1538 domain-containing protein n=1 Tax=Natronogracilivirga saccharolytica TaxID=2812953 RepID=A0A8J7RI63_9BACT|nr:DUF1538 domain-containing protein [Natronogracilivirga saccharolytica]MBP3192250.1 DUF1538 domain-containing protein [Natronogracilivirga saccharolytica]
MQNVRETITEVVQAVIPVTVIVIILQFTIIWLPMEDFLQFIVGAVMVSAGLIFFLLGVHIGLLPIGEMIGSALPQIGKVWIIILISFLLGFVVTVAEPDVRVLANYVDTVSDGEVNRHLLIYTVALGLAIFVGLAIMRIIFDIPIKYLLMGGYLLIFILAIFVPEQFISISFDAGGVTTGPLAVPFILAYGIGVAAVLGGRKTTDNGFGLVALASIGPVLAVLILGIIYG